jgi:bifunctional N-acetylglucosamine-1-phosphate-uridyltransferase/glucosamine-1-phosphate-acetyltransferase GlmU-like protein
LSNKFIVPTRPTKKLDNDDDLAIILLSSGVPYGMKTYGPKQLLPTKFGLTFIEHQLSIIKALYKNSEIIVVLGYEIDRILKKKPQARIIENQLFETTADAEQLRLAMNSTNKKNLLIISGDVFFNDEALSFNRKKTCILCSEEEKSKNEIGVSTDSDKVLYLSYDIKDLKWNNIIFVHERNYSSLYSITHNRENSVMYMPEIINCMLEKDVDIQKIANEYSFAQKIDTSIDIGILTK